MVRPFPTGVTAPSGGCAAEVAFGDFWIIIIIIIFYMYNSTSSNVVGVVGSLHSESASGAVEQEASAVQLPNVFTPPAGSSHQ